MSEENKDNTAPDASAIEERLNYLTKAREDAHARAERLEAEVARLTGSLASIEAKLVAPKPAPQAPSALLPSRSSQSTQEDLSSLVREAIKEAIGPIQEKLSASEKAAELSRKHAPAYQAALSQYPSLSDPESDMARIANQLWETRPDLQSLPDAPFVIATMAHGLVTDARIRDGKTRETKTQLGAKVPTGGRNAPPDDADKIAQAVKETRDSVLSKPTDVGSLPGRSFAKLLQAKITEMTHLNKPED